MGPMHHIKQGLYQLTELPVCAIARYWITSELGMYQSQLYAFRVSPTGSGSS